MLHHNELWADISLSQHPWMLIGATIAIAMPNPVHAAFSYCINGVLPCFDNKGDCQKELRNIVTKAKCERQKPL